MRTADLPIELTVAWLRERYLEGAWSPEEVVRVLAERASCDEDMGIWITPPSLESARPYLERLRTLDPANYPLWGIPFAVKDNIDVAGMDTTAACPAFAYRPVAHSAVVQRLVDAGAIPLGKTNMDQFATGLVGIRSPYGETHNALRHEMISGGSSSGSAVAVARGHAVFALGTDTAGSGRIPAALNGVIGYKPGHGAWPLSGVVPACPQLDCVNVFVRTHHDAWLVDSAVRGTCEDDPWSRTRAATGLAPKLPSVLYVPEREPLFYGPYAEHYQMSWELALRRLHASGIPVVVVDTDFLAEAAAVLYDGPWIAERWSVLGEFVEAHPNELLPVTELILRGGADESGYSAASLFRAMHRLRELTKRVGALLDDAVLVLPTCGGTWTREQVRLNPVDANSDMGRYTNHCNLLDLCAIALPAGEAADSIPFGITLFAPADREAQLRGAAAHWAQDTGDPRIEGGGVVRPHTPMVRIAVCGLHMRGFPLEKQMLEHGARFAGTARTAPEYRMIKLPQSPSKPGLIRVVDDGASVELELWDMPLAEYGAFVATIPEPLGIGRIQLEDGVAVQGFVCEAHAYSKSRDITSFGGWRSYIKSLSAT